MRPHSSFEAETHGEMWILVRDLSSDREFLRLHGQPKTVTNDAEAVVQWCLMRFARCRMIAYRDSEGEWSELKHDGYQFTGFAPLDDGDRASLGDKLT